MPKKESSTPVCKIPDCDRPVKYRGWCGIHLSRWRRHGDPLAGRTIQGEPHKFLESILESDTNDCIEWPFYRDVNGYGHITIDGISRPAHRIVLIRHTGIDMGPNYEACHAPLICHNRSCCNPKHLLWGTSKDNKAHKLLDGTAPRGEKNGTAKLTDKQVLAIFNDKRHGSVIAPEYKVNRNTINGIKSGATWSHITGKKHQPNGSIKAEKHYKSRLSNEQVLAIYNDQRSDAEIAKDYGVVPGTIWNIKNGVNYKSVTNHHQSLTESR